jgi:hypothetical protein
MGSWGTDVFSNDLALDIRADFRELIAAGRSPREATELILARFEMAEPRDAYDGQEWLALAVTQWKMGRVVDGVRDTALRAIELELAEPIFEGTDIPKRAGVLFKARDLLNSTPPAPRRVRAERVAQSPFAPVTSCGTRPLPVARSPCGRCTTIATRASRASRSTHAFGCRPSAIPSYHRSPRS